MLSKTPAKLAPQIPPEAARSTELDIVPREGEDMQAAATRMLVGPLASARIVLEISTKQSGQALDLAPFADALVRAAKLVNSGNIDDVEATLVNQATALNVMFGELGSVAISHMDKHPETADRFFRMAMKAQNQCRITLETLSNMKNPPVIYARQANISNGAQQVNNGIAPPSSHTGENQNPPIQLLERSNEPRMDTPAQSPTGSSNSAVETMAAVNRASDSAGYGDH
jgi:hypothetical protein